MTTSKDNISVFRMTPGLHDLLKFIASREERKLNNQIYFFLHRALKNYKSEDEAINKKIEEYFKAVDGEQAAKVVQVLNEVKPPEG